MKTALTHLPQVKQGELEALKELALKHVPAEMVILFGSYARGEWVEDYQDNHEYVSDFDILIVAPDRKAARRDKRWRNLEEALRDHSEITRTNIIHHSIGFVNDKIENSSYFFIDILKDGIMLYDSENFKLAAPKPQNPEQRQANAKEEFEHWYESANDFLEQYEFAFERGKDKLSAFLLHQATERYYAAILLVFTAYKPKTHDIEDLGQQTAHLHPDLIAVFPKTTDEQKRLFELLKKSYIDARYIKSFAIEKNELEYLSQRVKLLKELTERICKEKIEGFTANS